MESTNPFPAMTGTEEEIRLNIVGLDHDSFERYMFDLLDGIDEFCPTLPGSNEYRANGSRTYFDKKGIELATPEVDNPLDQFIYVNAGINLLTKSLSKFLVSESQLSGREQYGWMHRRVVDSQDNTWGGA